MMSLLMTSSLYAQSFLEVPVKVDIENGNMDDVLIKVLKNGKTAFSQSSASKLKLKLNFNCVYTIVFSKPGYISKSVEFDTKAPKDHITDGFDPYKIGVKLFKQYDGVNITVYNQPVGKIRFDKDLDEFNYDTDYSKSILHDLQATEDKLAAKADEEKKSGIAAPVVTETHQPVTTTPDIVPTTTSASTDQQAIAPAAQQDPQINKPGNAGNDVTTKTMGSGGSQTKDYMAMDGSSEITPSTVVSQGADAGTASHNNAGDDKSIRKLPKQSGNDVGIPSTHDENEKITREDIVENNRIITLVKVTRGRTTTEYRRVNYHWGGPFYFVNNVSSISENVFTVATGVKD